MSQVAANQLRSFASPSLTPSHQFRGGEGGGHAAQAPSMPAQLGTGALPSSIIFNINGNTHINNFHHHHGPQQYNSAQADGQIQGRKVDRPQLRFGKDASSNSLEQPGQNQPGQRDRRLDLPLGLNSGNLGNKTAKTMIPKKLLAQAKSAKHARVTPKGILRGQGKGLTGNVDELQKVMKRQTTQPGHGSLNQTTKSREKKTTPSQFDFNFNGSGKSKDGGQTNVTIDYETHQRRGTLAPHATEGAANGLLVASGRDGRARRQSSFSFNNLQSLIGKQQGNSHTNKLAGNKTHKAAKSSRPMTQAKQASTLTKHRRHKSEVKRGYQQFPAKPMTKINTLLRQANTSTTHPTKTSNSKRGKHLEQNKENLNMSNTGADRSNHKMAATSQPPRGAAKTVAHKSHSRRQREGMSISSFSSNSNRVNGGHSQAGSSRHNSRGRHPGSSIAEQLSKSYFLNSKQLLRHLSPARPEQQADISQMAQPNSGDRVLSHQLLSGQEGASSGLSQRQQPSRGRNRSTAVAKASGSQGAKAKQRKNHSHSQSKSYNKQQLSLRQNPPMPSMAASGSSSQQAAQHQGTTAAAVQLMDQKFSKSRSPHVMQANPGTQPQSQNKINKQAVDKLIKENLRKNKNKQDEACMKKQLEAVRQQQRKAELTQRNQEVRMINASRIVHHGGAANQVGNHANDVSGKAAGEQNIFAHNGNTSKEEPQQRRRSRSCIDYSNKKGGAGQSGGDRGTMQIGGSGHHSHGNNRQHQQQQPTGPQPGQINQKPVPHTTTNQANRSSKPRSFVDEINQLTQLVEQEIGHDQMKSTQAKAGNSRGKNMLNQTAIEPNVNDKTLLYKKPKQNRPSVGIQKFIERRKRAEQVKKSLEQTIEVDKQVKIQKNLHNLDKFVKRHLRQRSQPAISQKKASGSGSIALHQPKKIPQKRTKKQKASAEPINTVDNIGLSEIFQQVYPNPALASDLRRNITPINGGDENLSAILPENEPGQDQTNLELDSHLRHLDSQNMSHQVGKSSKSNAQKAKAASQGKKPASHTSGKYPGKSRKSVPQERGGLALQSTAGTRVETASGVGPHRKSSAPGTSNMMQQQRQVALYPEKQLSGPDTLPSNQPTHNQFFSNPLQQKPAASKSHQKGHHGHHTSQPDPGPDQSNWLARKHPGSDQSNGYNRGNRPLRNFQKPADIDLTPGSHPHEQVAHKQTKPKRGEPEPAQLNPGYSKTDLSMTSAAPEDSIMNMYRKDQSLNQSMRLSPKSTENIRRVHELVALYRCRFKANVSDASVMGTLHSAASVIQIHFRYLRHLREAEADYNKELGNMAPDGTANLQQRRNHGIAKKKKKDEEEYKPLDELESSGYIDSEKEQNMVLPVSRHFKPKAAEVKAAKFKQERETTSKYKYVETTEKKRNPKLEDFQDHELGGLQESGERQAAEFNNRFRFVERLTPVESSRSEVSAGLAGAGAAGDLLGHEATRGEKQFISSVLPESAWNSGPAPTGLQPSAASSPIRTPAQQMMSKQSASMPQAGHTDPAERQDTSGKKMQNQNQQAASNQSSEKKQTAKKEQGNKKNERNKYQQQNPSMRNKARPSIDVEVVEEDYHQAQLKQQPQTQLSQKEMAKQSPSLKGQKTPQVPGLDLNRLHVEKAKHGLNKQEHDANGNKNVASNEKNSEIDFYGHHAERPAQDVESLNSQSQQTVSSYRGIFNRLGLPLPRSARVKVDYDLVQKDPKITEQLKEIVHFKDLRGRQVMEEGRRDNLITERTYEINRRKLEKWVSSSYNKIEDNQRQKSAKKPRIQTQEQLLQATQDDRKRLQGQLGQLLHDGDRLSAHSATGRPSGRQSGRQNSHMSQSWRGGQTAAGVNSTNQYPSYRAGASNKGENYTDRDPYGHGPRGNSNTTDNYKANMAIGSGRQHRSKLVELINSSRTSSKPKKDQSASDSRKNPAESSSYGGQEPARLEDVQIHIDEQRVAGYERSSDPEQTNSKHQSQGRAMNYIMNDKDGSQRQSNTEKSLNRSQSHPTIHNDLEREMVSDLNMASDNDEVDDPSKQFEDSNDVQMVDPNQIEYQLEDALRNEHRKQQEKQEAEESPRSSARLERDELSHHMAQRKPQETKAQPKSSHSKPPGELEDVRHPRFFISHTAELQGGEDGEADGSKKKQEQTEDLSEDDKARLVPGRGGMPEEAASKTSSKAKPNPFKSRTPQLNNFLEPTANETEEIEEESSAGKNTPQEDKQSDQMTGPRNSMNSSEEERNKDQTGATNMSSTVLSGSLEDQDKTLFGQSNNQSYLDASKGSSSNIIKVENQLNDVEQEMNLSSKQTEGGAGAEDASAPQSAQSELPQKQIEVGANVENIALGHPVSPVSDSQACEFKIQTGAHSLSSTDSDMAKAIHAANRDYDSPPDLISPKNQKPSLTVVDQSELKQEQEQFADQIAHYILSHLVAEASEEMESLVSRPQLHPQKAPERYIKYFDQKGIKTNLFAIEKYFDEVLVEVQQTREEFMKEINRPLSKNQLEALYQMQNSEIGSYDHFQQNLPPILSLDLYLNLEKRRKESRENPNAFLQSGREMGPNGLFDFENVTDEDLKQDQVDKNYLAECQHIHNKVLFDCINDCLQQFRPYGKDGAPMVWSRLGRKLKPTEDFTLEEMFEITKHDLYQMAITQSGTLPRREFVFGGKFDDELFAEIREKKLAGLLCREIIETEPQWLKWDFEEAQTKIDIGDMVLEALVTETIEFLNKKSSTKNEKKSAAQSNFEELQEKIKQASPGLMNR